MSLINDALRRANQQKEQAYAPSDGSPMQPVQPSERTKASFAGPMLLIFFLGVVLTCAAWFFWKGWSGTPTAAQATQQSSTVSPEPVPVLAPPQTAPERTLPVAQVVESSSAAPPPNAVASNRTEPVASAPEAIPPTPPVAPPLKLQGIFYRINKPTALISGRTVGVGEKVEGARVLKIDRSQVALERDGETIILTLN